MYRYLEHLLAQRVLECLERRHSGVTLPRVVIEQPPRVELGDFAIPMFPFAKPLRSAPLKIAEAIRAEIGEIQGVAGMTVTPPGYLNVKMDRAWMAAALASDRKEPGEIPHGKILVEHSSINPNKAAHIGHLRNADSGGHIRAPAALRGKGSRRSELHRQYRRAGRRCDRWVHSYRKEIARGDRGTRAAAAI